MRRHQKGSVFFILVAFIEAISFITEKCLTPAEGIQLSRQQASQIPEPNWPAGNAAGHFVIWAESPYRTYIKTLDFEGQPSRAWTEFHPGPFTPLRKPPRWAVSETTAAASNSMGKR
jgi:hypothetical protein